MEILIGHNNELPYININLNKCTGKEVAQLIAAVEAELAWLKGHFPLEASYAKDKIKGYIVEEMLNNKEEN